METHLSVPHMPEKLSVMGKIIRARYLGTCLSYQTHLASDIKFHMQENSPEFR